MTNEAFPIAAFPALLTEKEIEDLFYKAMKKAEADGEIYGFKLEAVWVDKQSVDVLLKISVPVEQLRDLSESD